MQFKLALSVAIASSLVAAAPIPQAAEPRAELYHSQHLNGELGVPLIRDFDLSPEEHPELIALKRALEELEDLESRSEQPEKRLGFLRKIIQKAIDPWTKIKDTYNTVKKLFGKEAADEYLDSSAFKRDLED